MKLPGRIFVQCIHKTWKRVTCNVTSLQPNNRAKSVDIVWYGSGVLQSYVGTNTYKQGTLETLDFPKAGSTDHVTVTTITWVSNAINVDETWFKQGKNGINFCDNNYF